MSVRPPPTARLVPPFVDGHAGGKGRHPQGGRWFSLALTAILVTVPMVPGCDCGDELDLIRPTLVVEPGEAIINGVPVAQDTEIVFRVPNARSVNLDNVVAFLDDGSDPAFTIVKDTIERVRPATSEELVVKVRPRVPGTIEALLIVDSDPNAIPDHVEVPITITAIDVGLPDIEVNPDGDVLFDVISRADVAREKISVKNVGLRDLIIDGVTEPEDPAFTLAATLPPGTIIAPGTSLDITIAFRPGDTETHTSTIAISSNDPDESPVELRLSAQAVECPEAIAVLVDEGDIEPFDTVRLDGRNSVSGAAGTSIPPPPDGYEWQLVQRPIGSTATLSSLSNNVTELETDLAGFYQVQLTVFAIDDDRPDAGLIRSCAPAIVDVDVVPSDDLHIQLVWDHPDADFDLHIVREDGRAFNHDSDCYFSNRNPERTPELPSWSLNPDENPRLDVDDNRGYGPENGNIKHPEPGSRWTVLVHYWNKQTGNSPAATATVRVFVLGRQAIELSQSFEDDQQMWRALEIVWGDSPLATPTLSPLNNVDPFPRPF